MFFNTRFLCFLVTVYSPLGSPERAWTKPSYSVLLDEPKIAEIAKKYSKSIAQICIKWQIERDITVVLKSFAASRIQENADVSIFSFEIFLCCYKFHRFNGE